MSDLRQAAMPPGGHYNNLAIEAFGIASVMGVMSRPVAISKLLLIPPIISHKPLVQNLSRKNTRVMSFEKYLVDHLSFFINFNGRFYDRLIGSVNAIQLLNELGFIEFIDGGCTLRKAIIIDKSMGGRAERISKASSNIASLISTSVEDLYLNLRIEV